MRHEFDNYIDKYRDNCSNALWLSGESSDYFALYKAQKLKSWFPNNQYKSIKILDFGCGDGLMTHYVSTLFSNATVYGVDPSEKSIIVAQKKFPHIQFQQNSETSTHLNFKDHTFDIIFSAGTFHHIPFAMHKNYLNELLRVLKPSGRLVIFELNPLNPLTVYTFKNNPIDAHAKMLNPWYAYNLTKAFAKPTLKFICFFPKPLKWLRGIEFLFTKVPFGALYSLIIEKRQ
jgi:ubiquinone/menaquinone biosynthesis C-methylase UbiE